MNKPHDDKYDKINPDDFVYLNDLARLDLYLEKVSRIYRMMGAGPFAIEYPALNVCYMEVLEEIDAILEKDHFTELRKDKPELLEGLLGNASAGVTDMDSVAEFLVPEIGRYRNKIAKTRIQVERKLKLPDILAAGDDADNQDQADSELLMVSPREKILLSKLDTCMEEYQKAYSKKKSELFPEESDTQHPDIIDEKIIEKLDAISLNKPIKLIHLCKSINTTYRHEHYMATAILSRALLDYVPSIFGHNNVQAMIKNVKTKDSHKKAMQKLDSAIRLLADDAMHARYTPDEGIKVARADVDNMRGNIRILLERIHLQLS